MTWIGTGREHHEGALQVRGYNPLSCPMSESCAQDVGSHPDKLCEGFWWVRPLSPRHQMLGLSHSVYTAGNLKCRMKQLGHNIGLNVPGRFWRLVVKLRETRVLVGRRFLLLG